MGINLCGAIEVKINDEWCYLADLCWVDRFVDLYEFIQENGEDISREQVTFMTKFKINIEDDINKSYYISCWSSDKLKELKLWLDKHQKINKLIDWNSLFGYWSLFNEYPIDTIRMRQTGVQDHRVIIWFNH